MYMFLTIKDFPALSQNEDFEESTNIGLTNICFDKRLLQCDHTQESINFINASYQEIAFSVGGFFNPSSLPDGDPYNTLAIALWIQNKRVLTALYHDRISAGKTAKDFEMLDIEQLNENPLLNKILLGLESEIGILRKEVWILSSHLKNTLLHSQKFTTKTVV